MQRSQQKNRAWSIGSGYKQGFAIKIKHEYKFLSSCHCSYKQQQRVMQSQQEEKYSQIVQWFKKFQIQPVFDCESPMESSSSSNSEDIVHEKKQQTNTRKARKYARYRPLIKGVKTYLEEVFGNTREGKKQIKKILEKVKPFVKSEKSYSSYFVWLVFIFGQQLDSPQRSAELYQILKKKIETCLKEKVISHSEKYGEEFAAEEKNCVEFVIQQTQLFFKNRIMECIQNCYMKKNEEEKQHGNTLHYMENCKQQVEKAFNAIKKSKKIL